MKLILDGNINQSDIQKMVMIYFPGEKFSQQEQLDNDVEKELYLRLEEYETGCEAYVNARVGDKTASSQKFVEYTQDKTFAKSSKIACGSALIETLTQLVGYRPSWGMLTGVRPSKIATELLHKNLSRARVRRTLVSDYLVSPKKAALATDVAMNEMKIIDTPNKKDCSIYISIPFCPTRCSYCSFVSYTTPKLLQLIPEYVEKLLFDLVKTVHQIKELNLNVKTLYIGGGTPTILDDYLLSLLLGKINSLLDVNSLEEFTVEAGRPDTFTKEKLRILKENGVTRICVNPQSLCQDVLCNIGRTHTPEDFLRAYDMARESQIKCINTDLIIGLPGDNFKTFSMTFDKIMTLNPENVTVHTFCVKKAADILRQNSNIFSAKGGDAGKCVDYSQLQADSNGYIPYYMYRQKNTIGNFENVGFAKPGFEGRYNVYMMEEVHSIFAVGAGAVSKLVTYDMNDSQKTHIDRLFYPKYPYEYLKDNTLDEKNAITRAFYEKYFTE